MHGQEEPYACSDRDAEKSKQSSQGSFRLRGKMERNNGETRRENRFHGPGWQPPGDDDGRLHIGAHKI